MDNLTAFVNINPEESYLMKKVKMDTSTAENIASETCHYFKVRYLSHYNHILIHLTFHNFDILINQNTLFLCL